MASKLPYLFIYLYLIENICKPCFSSPSPILTFYTWVWPYIIHLWARFHINLHRKILDWQILHRSFFFQNITWSILSLSRLLSLQKTFLSFILKSQLLKNINNNMAQFKILNSAVVSDTMSTSDDNYFNHSVAFALTVITLAIESKFLRRTHSHTGMSAHAHSYFTSY